MFIHGKLYLTHHSIMLDETRSLLQKSLRRKEWVLALQAAKELLGHQKDQLPWKSIVTYLLEDHCLSDTDVVMVIFKAFEEGTIDAKYRCIELLMQCSTCRVAACLPVIALDSPYEPKHWNEDIDVRESVRGLVTHTEGQINTDQLLEHLLRAWQGNNPDGVITYMKLATMVIEHEKRQLTQKGKEFLISSSGKIRRLHFGLVVLSVLYKNTDDASMRGYLAACHRLATIPDVCLRLILFAPLTRLMFSDKVSGLSCKKMGRVDWKTVRRLTYMPPWAVDKHTFRGKFGRGTKSILKKKPQGMTEEQYEEFHGPREKRDLQSFFDEGVKCTKESLEENPFWERTKELYFLQPPKQQKTQYMTQQFYTLLKVKYPEIFQSTRSVFFDYSDKRSSAPLFDPPKQKPQPPDNQRNIQDFFKTLVAETNPSVKAEPIEIETVGFPSTKETEAPKRKRSESPQVKETPAPKRKRSETRDSIESPPDEGLSRAQRRRLKETARRKSEYESEHIKGARKVHGIMSRDFAEAAKKLGCPVNLPDKLFDDDYDILNGEPVPGTSKSDRTFSLSGEDSSSEQHNLGSPLGSPMAAYLGGEAPRAGLRTRTSSAALLDTSLESNGLGADFLDGLDDEFEEEMDVNEDTGEQLASQEETYEEQVEQQEEGDEEEEGEEEDETTFMSFRGPLLQLPTGAGKVYTCADIEAGKVIKGPYRNKNTLNMCMFLNQVMRDVIDDPHTLDFEPDSQYISFPLIQGHGASMEVTTRDFTDCISKADIKDAEFITRDCMGIVQLHKLHPPQVRKLPVSIWAHFLFRFALNVGDSGLYNAITDSKLTFVYGIDITEMRGPVNDTDDLMTVMFSKAPRKDLREAILVQAKKKKMELLRLVSKPINYATMDRLAREYGVEYDRLQFIERIKKVRQLVAKLK